MTGDETEQELRTRLANWGWPEDATQELMPEQLRMAARLLERFERMNDPALPDYLRDAAFGRAGAKVVNGEGAIAARHRGSAAEAAEDLAEALRECKLDEALSLLEAVRYYLKEQRLR